MAISWRLERLRVLATQAELEFADEVAAWIGLDGWRSDPAVIDLLARRVAIRLAEAIVAERGVSWWTALLEAEADLRPDAEGPRALATRVYRQSRPR